MELTAIFIWSNTNLKEKGFSKTEEAKSIYCNCSCKTEGGRISPT